MAMNFKKPSKKTAIITIVAVIILLAIAITGTVVFLRDRGTTGGDGGCCHQSGNFQTGYGDRRGAYGSKASDYK